MKTVDQLMGEAFDVGRDPRSDEYRAGVRAALAFRIEGRGIRNPFPAGTAQSDAWFAGVTEGHQIWRAEQNRERDG